MHAAVQFAGRFLICSALIVVMVWAPGLARGQELFEPEAVPTPEAPPEVTQQERDEAARQAEQSMEEREYERAFEAYTTVAAYGQQQQVGQDFIAGVIGRARALAAMQEYAEALRPFEEIRAEPQFVHFLVARGEIYLEMRDPERALADFQAVVRINRGDMQAVFGLGKSLVQLGQWQAAIRPLTRVLEADPENVEPYRARGTDQLFLFRTEEMAEAYRLRGTAHAGVFKRKEAVDDLQQSIQLNPEDHETYAMLGVVYLRDEDYQAAVDELRRAIEHYTPPPGLEDQPYVQGYLTLSSVYMELGKQLTEEEAKRAAYESSAAEAEKLLEQLDEKNPNTAGVRAASYYSRGVAERMAGRIGEAIQSFSRALELNPELGEAYFRRGICFHLIGEDQMAISDFVEAAHISFDDARPRMWEGFMHAKVGDYHEANRAYSEAISASDRFTPAFANRALAYMALGEYEKAIANFDDAIRMDPINADYYFQRGVAYQLRSDFQRASESFANAIRFDSQHAAAHRRMAEVLQRLGHTELAGEYRQRGEELAPEGGE